MDNPRTLSEFLRARRVRTQAATAAGRLRAARKYVAGLPVRPWPPARVPALPRWQPPPLGADIIRARTRLRAWQVKYAAWADPGELAQRLGARAPSSPELATAIRAAIPAAAKSRGNGGAILLTQDRRPPVLVGSPGASSGRGKWSIYYRSTQHTVVGRTHPSVAMIILAAQGRGGAA